MSGLVGRAAGQASSQATLARFEAFLGGVNLESHRKRYGRIKTVELDLPRAIQPLRAMYETYWDCRDASLWMGYGEFYDHYRSTIPRQLEEFRVSCRFSRETFYLGLPARIYRTWASILTQIQAAYVLEGIYGRGKVRMGVELDRSGTDIAVRCLGDHDLYIQVKKETMRRDFRGSATVKRGSKKKKVILEYAVPAAPKFLRSGKLSKPYRDWEREWGDRLEYLKNGFVVFRPEYFDLGNLIAELAPDGPRG